MITSACLLICGLFIACWVSRQDIQNDPTLGIYDDSEPCRAFCNFCILSALMIGGGIALIHSFAYDADDNVDDDTHDLRRDQQWLKYFDSIAGPSLGVGLIFAGILVLLLILSPIIAIIYGLVHCCRYRLVHCYRYHRGYTLANNNMTQEEREDMIRETYCFTALTIPVVILLSIYCIRVLMGKNDVVSDSLNFMLIVLTFISYAIVWAVVLMYAMLAISPIIAIIYLVWQERDRQAQSALTFFCPQSSMTIGDFCMVVFSGALGSVIVIGMGIYGVNNPPEIPDAESEDVVLESGEKAFHYVIIILAIEAIVLGLGLFLAFVVYPIYASIICFVRNACCVGNGRRPAATPRPHINCDDERTVEPALDEQRM